MGDKIFSYGQKQRSKRGQNLTRDEACRYFSTLLFSKYSFRNNIRMSNMSNSLDPDQAQHSVEPDLGQNCLQRLSADDKIRQ